MLDFGREGKHGRGSQREEEEDATRRATCDSREEVENFEMFCKKRGNRPFPLLDSDRLRNQCNLTKFKLRSARPPTATLRVQSGGLVTRLVFQQVEIQTDFTCSFYFGIVPVYNTYQASVGPLDAALFLAARKPNITAEQPWDNFTVSVRPSLEPTNNYGGVSLSLTSAYLCSVTALSRSPTATTRRTRRTELRCGRTTRMSDRTTGRT